MYKIITLALLAVSCCTGLSAAPFSLQSLRASDLAAAAVPEAPQAPAPKEWTVIFYANTKDTLGGSQFMNLNDMRTVGSTDKVNVVVETGHTFQQPGAAASTVTLRMVLTKSTSPANIDGDIVSARENADMGDWRAAADFAKWAKANYPAKRYLFVIYAHGAGFFDIKKKSDAKGISYDAQTGNYITIPELGLLMKEAGPVDALVLQSCLMQMAEVSYQLRNSAEVIVGSEEEMFAAGFGFRDLLLALNADPSISNKDIGALLTASYVRRVQYFKLPGGHASTLVTAALPGLADRVNAWVDAVLPLNDAAAAAKARAEVVRFSLRLTNSVPPAVISPYADLSGFVKLFSENLDLSVPGAAEAALRGAELRAYIAGELLASYDHYGKTNTDYDYALAHGLSIYVPPQHKGFPSAQFEQKEQTRYTDLDFAGATRWKQLVDWMYSLK